jgi:transposase-like protein
MRHDYSTEQFNAFRGEARESFWGQIRWRTTCSTNPSERCFVEVRRRTWPMVVSVNVASVERIIYAISQRFNQQWQNHTLRLFT